MPVEPDMSETLAHDGMDRHLREMDERRDLVEQYSACALSRWQRLKLWVRLLNHTERRWAVLRVLASHRIGDEGWMLGTDIAGGLGWGPTQLGVLYSILGVAINGGEVERRWQPGGEHHPQLQYRIEAETEVALPIPKAIKQEAAITGLIVGVILFFGAPSPLWRALIEFVVASTFVAWLHLRGAKQMRYDVMKNHSCSEPPTT